MNTCINRCQSGLIIRYVRKRSFVKWIKEEIDKELKEREKRRKREMMKKKAAKKFSEILVFMGILVFLKKVFTSKKT